VVSKIFGTKAVKLIKLTIRPIGRHHPRSSPFPHVDTGPTVSSIFGTLPGSTFLSECQTHSAIRPGSHLWYQTGVLSASISFLEIGRSHRVLNDPGQGFIVGGELKKFSADVDALLLLFSCQDPGHKFGGDTVHAQFFRQNPLACPITHSHLLSNVVNSPTSILTEELLNSCNSFRSCAACGSPYVFVIVN
jgi:hypothetical protein